MKIFWRLFKRGRTTAKIGIKRVEAKVVFHPTWAGEMKFTFTPHAGLLLQKNGSAHTLSGINDYLEKEVKRLLKIIRPDWEETIISKGNGVNGSSVLIAVNKSQ